MLSFDEAIQKLRALPIEGRVESVPLAAALGRILAEPLAASSDQPPFDRTTMDGFAVALNPGTTRFRVIGTVLAGDQFDGTLKPGEALRIMTGAPCPSGATVVPIERTDGGQKDAGQDVVVIEAEALIPDKNIAWQGQDAKAGQQVVGRGTRMSPQTLSSAAMAGVSEIQAFSPPSVGIVTTGDEIGATGPASVRNSNGPLLAALCAALGVPFKLWHARDEAGELEAVLGEARDATDLVVTVGGVSMGTADLVPGTAQRLGYEPILHKVAMQPGKPVFLAIHSSAKPFLGLPGNPVSVLVTAHLFLAPLIGRYLGGWEPQWQSIPLAKPHSHRGGRRLFLPAYFAPGGVAPVAWNGSGDFYSAARGDGLVDLAAGGSWEAGELVSFLPFLGHTLGETGI